MNNRRNFLGGLAVLPFIPNLSLAKGGGLKEEIISKIYKEIDIKKIDVITYNTHSEERLDYLCLYFWFVDNTRSTYIVNVYLESDTTLFNKGVYRNQNTQIYKDILSVQELLEIGEYFRNLYYGKRKNTEKLL